MTFRYPFAQQQFAPNTATSHADCTAAAAGTAADADSKGKIVYNHAQVRAASDEATPDHDSPGLNLQQIDAALFRLSGGRINLDVHPWNGGSGSPFSAVGVGLRAGKWAVLSVWRGVLVDAGFGGGSGFRKGHAVVLGYDQDHDVYVLSDPLVPGWQVVTLALMERACRALLIASGAGAGATGAYFALTRDVYDENAATLHYSARFTAGRFWRYSVVNDVITGREAHSFSGDTSAPCEAQREFPWPGHASRKLARVTKGALAGFYVESGSAHVRVEVSK